MKKSLKDRLANRLVDELFDRIDGDAGPTGERVVEESDREHERRVREYLRAADRSQVETNIDSARTLLDQLDLSDCDGEVSWELEYRVHHARGVLANAFLALYGGFGERPTPEA